MSTMDRLDFLKYAGWVAMGAVLLPKIEGCSTSTPTTPTGVDVTYHLADFPVLSTVGDAAIDSARAIILYRVSATEFKAFSAICSHMQCTVAVNNLSHRYECPCHGSVYAADGTVIQGPAPRSLTSYHAAFDSGAGTVHVTSA